MLFTAANLTVVGRLFRSHLTIGFAIGAFFSLMSASFAYEDPMARAQLTTTQKASEIFKEMGRGMWKSGKGFGKVGALFAGIECVIESVSTSTRHRLRFYDKTSHVPSVSSKERHGQPHYGRLCCGRRPCAERWTKSSLRWRCGLRSLLSSNRPLPPKRDIRVREQFTRGLLRANAVLQR